MQIRNRIDTPVQTRSWPPLLRLFEFSVHTAIFVLRREVAVTLTLAISQFSNGPVTRLAASF
jgi:hypothetical protein